MRDHGTKWHAGEAFEPPQVFAGRVLWLQAKAQRAWHLYGHLQRAVGVRRMFTLSSGAAVIVAVSAPLPWYWKVALFLAVAALLSVTAAAVCVCW
jgi:hypothetical protein